MAGTGGGKGVSLHYKRFEVFSRAKTTDLQGNLHGRPPKISKNRFQYRKSGQVRGVHAASPSTNPA